MAFCVLSGGIVALAPRSTHATIFAALRVVADPAAGSDIERARLARGGAAAIFEDFGIEFYPGPPSQKDLKWFKEGAIQELGQRRRLTLAGRAWKEINLNGTNRNVLSWWVERSEVPAEAVLLVAQALGLRGTCFLEFEDSERPETLVLSV